MAAKTKKEKTEAKVEYRDRLQKVFGLPDMAMIEKQTVQFESREEFDSDMYWRTGIIPFDMLSGGFGLPQGRLVHFWCENGIGKTTMYYAVIRSAIAYSGLKVWWLAFEPSEKLAWDMKMLGPDKLYGPESFRYMTAHYYDDFEKLVKQFVASDADVLVVDSLTALVPNPETLKDAGSLVKATVGRGAGVETTFLKNIHAWFEDSGKTLMYITQARNKIATKKWQKSGLFQAGSEASNFFSDMRISMRGATRITAKEAGMDSGLRHVCTKGWIYAEKDRHAPPGVKIPVTILFGSGVSNITAMREFLLWEGSRLIMGGGWYTTRLGGEEQKVQGVPALHAILKKHQSEILDLFYSGKNAEYHRYWQEQSAYDDTEGEE